MRRGIRVKLALAAAVGASLLVPAAGQATVTIGSNLASAPSVGLSCLGTVCTYGQVTLPAGVPATGGVTSPTNGTVTQWRVRTGTPPNPPLAFRVIRPLPGGLFMGVGTSTTVTPPDSATTPYPVAIPIQVGDLIGMNCCQATSFYFRLGGMGAARLWNPALADGGAGRAPTDSNATYELTINADIEPTSAFTIGKPTRKKGGKLEVTATLPNVGTLVAGDVKDPAIGASAAAKPKPRRKLKSTTAQVTTPGAVTFIVKPTKFAKGKLQDTGKVKAQLKLAFTPTGGSASTQTTKVKLKSKP